MLKKLSVALLAASILAAPALAAGPAKIDAAGHAVHIKSATAKPQLRKIARHHHKHRHFAHRRHHDKVTALHSPVKVHAPKARIGLNKLVHKKVSLKPITPVVRRG
jgi:hypothetical protein